MEHLRDEFDARGLVWVLFFKVHDEAKGAVFKRCIGGTDDDSIPVAMFQSSCASERDEPAAGKGYQVITLSAMGEAETPAGGSVCIRYGRCRSVQDDQ